MLAYKYSRFYLFFLFLVCLIQYGHNSIFNLMLNLKNRTMENSIMLHNLAPRELELLLKKSIKSILDEYYVNRQANFDELLTREQACSLLKINKTSLWKWTKHGKIIAYGIGNRVLYKKSELLESLVRIN